MANIHGFGSLGGNKPRQPDDPEEFSVGGASSQSSVLRPRGPNADLNQDLLAAARRNVAEGQEAVASQNLGNITLYKNGFIIGEGEFRDSKDPANRKCLEQLMQGNVPRELEPAVREQFPGAHQVGVNLVNRSQEEYEPPKPKFSFAQSQGQSLGGGVRGGDGQASQQQQQQQLQEITLGFSEAQPVRYELPEAEKKAGVVQLVLSHRRRVRVDVSQSTLLLDIFQHCMSLSGLGSDQFYLVSGFPPKPLEAPQATLSELGLIGSSIEQRLVK